MQSASERAPPPLVELLRGACRRAIWMDRFVRTTYFGLTTMHVLLGAAAAQGEVSGTVVACLVLVAACFHVHIFLMNDVIDLEVDATQPRRAEHVLVRGLRGDGVSKRSALVIAWIGAALVVALTLFLGAGRNAWLALAGAFAFIGVYNLWGKRFPVPPLTDFVQGVGWWGLILYGLWIVDPDAGLDAIANRTLPLLAFSMGFTLLITGVHGGLRDLVNDSAHGRTNTSIFLGARPAVTAGATPSDQTAVLSSWGVVAYSYAVLVLMFWPTFGFVGEASHFASGSMQMATAVAMAGIFAANCALIWHVVKPVESRRDAWASGHSVFFLLPAIVLYLLSSLPSPLLKWLVGLLFWVPLAFQARFMTYALRFLDQFAAPLPAAHVAGAEHVVDRTE